MRKMIVVLALLAPLGGCLAAAAVGAAGSVVGAGVKATGAVVGAVTPGGDDDDRERR